MHPGARGLVDEGLQCGGCAVFADCGAGEMCLGAACVPDTCPPDLPNIQVDAANTYSGDSSGAVDRFLSTCVAAPDIPEVAFTFVAPADMEVCLNTFGSGYDTILDVEAEGCGSGPAVCNDDFAGVQSSVRVVVRAGVRYNVRIEGFEGTGGPYVLNAGPCP